VGAGGMDAGGAGCGGDEAGGVGRQCGAGGGSFLSL